MVNLHDRKFLSGGQNCCNTRLIVQRVHCKNSEKGFSLIFKLKYNIEIKNANEHYRHNKKVETTPQSHMTIPRYSAVR